MSTLNALARRGAMTFAAGALALGLAGPAAAEADFSGNTIEWIIPFSAGAGSDTWARFNAPLLSKCLPGNPIVVVVNEPGGGSTKGANLFAAREKSDGLTILGTSGSPQFPYLLGVLGCAMTTGTGRSRWCRPRAAWFRRPRLWV